MRKDLLLEYLVLIAYILGSDDSFLRYGPRGMCSILCEDWLWVTWRFFLDLWIECSVWCLLTMRDYRCHRHDPIWLLILIILWLFRFLSLQFFVALALAPDLNLLHVLLLLGGRFLLFHMLVLKMKFHAFSIVVGYVGYAFATLSYEFLECKIIGGWKCVVPIHLNLSPRLCCRCVIEWKAWNHILKPFHVHRYRVLANHNAWVVLTILNLFVPYMVLNIGDCETPSWVRIENSFDKIFAVFAHEFWNCVVSVEDLLVEHISLGVFKRQVAAYHSVENDSATPDVSRQAVVLLSSNHLWSRIARTSTGSLQSLPWLISVRKSEIDDLYVVIVVHQKVFWFQVSMTDAKLMHVLNTWDDLVQELGCHLLSDSLIIYNVLK